MVSRVVVLDAGPLGLVILAAQAKTLGVPDVVIATTNVGHLSRFAPAELWQDIQVASS